MASGAQHILALFTLARCRNAVAVQLATPEVTSQSQHGCKLVQLQCSSCPEAECLALVQDL